MKEKQNNNRKFKHKKSDDRLAVPRAVLKQPKERIQIQPAASDNSERDGHVFHQALHFSVRDSIRRLLGFHSRILCYFFCFHSHLFNFLVETNLQKGKFDNSIHIKHKLKL
jgi:hypothetical protein